MMPQDTPTEPEKGSILVFTAVAYFDGLTWAGLRQFMEVAQQEGVLDSEPVDLHYENDDHYSPLGISLTFRGRKPE